MTIVRVVPMCEMRDCGQRADYFWHWLVRPIITWIPVCHSCASALAEQLSGPFNVTVIAEAPGPVFMSSGPLDIIDARSRATRIHDL